MAHRFDLVDLQLFLHIAETATITHGANRSNMSLAAASERIRAMEDALGTPLLARKRRGIEVTPAGSALLHHATAVMQQLEQMRGELGSYAKGMRGHVRIVAVAGAVFEHLPKPLSAFLVANPNVDIDLEERRNSRILPEIAAGQADIGIAAGAIDTALDVETFPFVDNRFVLIVPSEHTLAKHKKVAFEQALAYEFVGLAADRGYQALAEQQARLAGLRMKVRARVSSVEAIAQMVAHGAGIAVAQEASAYRWQQIMPYAVVGLSDPWALRHIIGCVKNMKLLSPHTLRLVEFLRAWP